MTKCLSEVGSSFQPCLAFAFFLWSFAFGPSKADGGTSSQKAQRSKTKTCCHACCWIQEDFCFGYLARGAMGLGLHVCPMYSEDCITCTSRHGGFWCWQDSTAFAEIGIHWHFWASQWKLPQRFDEHCVPQNKGVCTSANKDYFKGWLISAIHHAASWALPLHVGKLQLIFLANFNSSRRARIAVFLG